MDFTNIPTEVADKIKNASTYEELADLAKESGLELSDDQLKAISGGALWSTCNEDGPGCPKNTCCAGSVPTHAYSASTCPSNVFMSSNQVAAPASAGLM